MRSTPPRWLLSCLLAALLACNCGCLNFIHPILPAPPEMAGPCLALPQHVRRHVHIFLMNGVDPLGAGNLAGLCDHIHKLGFGHTYYGQLYHAGWCEREMLRLQKEDPEGRIVLIGYGQGARVLRSLGQRLAAQGAVIDVLLALEPPAEDLGMELPFAVEVLGAPSCPETVARVAGALGQCASRVTVVEPPLPPRPEVGPVPRTVPPMSPQSFGPDWDSLQPTRELPPQPVAHVDPGTSLGVKILRAVQQLSEDYDVP